MNESIARVSPVLPAAARSIGARMALYGFGQALLHAFKARDLSAPAYDLLPDKYEGLYLRARARKGLAEYYATQGLTEERALELASHRVDFAKETRQMLYVNCWHVSNHESEAMWRIYCSGDNGLAVVLPYEDLRTSVSTGIAWIGMVRYLDFELDLLAPGDAFRAALHKRREFAYEQEARILSFGNVEFAKPADRPTFAALPWQIEVIKKIVVSPYATPAYFDMVRAALESSTPGLGSRVEHSSMAAVPD